MKATRGAGSILVAILLLASASVVGATTYVGVSDSNLVDQAAAVARVVVVSAEPGPAGGQPSTDYRVEVEEVVKGHLPGSTITVRVPGGVGADGLALKIWGAPEFRPGDEPLLFLAASRDGSFQILHLMLGAFHARRAEASELAVRDLSEAHGVRVIAGSDSGEEPGVRDLGRFTAWIADRALGIRRAADYWRQAPAEGPGSWREKFVETLATDGHPIRWFSFDEGGRVSWKLDPAGQPGLDFSQVEAAYQAALQAWTGDPTSSVQYIDGGAGNATGGLIHNDGDNTILFNDPGNLNLPQSFTCQGGGILGIGGVFFRSDSTRTHRGLAYHAAVEGDVVINDGTECFFKNNPSGLAEILAHELGHTLGFGHSLDTGALMRATAHNDGRGARLSDDDRLAASVVYGDGSFQPPPPPGPFKLWATSIARTNLQLNWANMPDGAAKLRLESQKGKIFIPLLTLPLDSASQPVTGLARNKAYVFRIAALGDDGKVLRYSNVLRLRTAK